MTSTTLRFSLNGEHAEVAVGSTVADAVALLLQDESPTGVAVSLDRCVIPRSEWTSTPIRIGSLVEVVSAAAGG